MRRSRSISRWTALAEYRGAPGESVVDRSATGPARSASSLFRVITVSLRTACRREPRLPAMRRPRAKRGPVVIERAFADRDDLKPAVAAGAIVFVVEKGGFLDRVSLHLVEIGLQIGATGRITVDAADPLLFADPVSLVGHEPALPRDVRKAGRPKPPRSEPLRMGCRSCRPARGGSPGGPDLCRRRHGSGLCKGARSVRRRELRRRTSRRPSPTWSGRASRK